MMGDITEDIQLKRSFSLNESFGWKVSVQHYLNDISHRFVITMRGKNYHCEADQKIAA